MSKFCSECGARLKVGAKFCSECGHRVEAEVAKDSPPLEPMPYEKPKTLQEIYAEKKAAAARTPAPSSVAEIFANAKTQAPVPSPVVQNTPPVSKSYSSVQEMYANARTQSASQNYNQSSGGWLYETFLRRDGRLNRLRFFKRILLADCIGFIAAVVVGIILDFNPDNTYHLGILCAVFISLDTWLDYGLIVRRSHDISKNSPWYKHVKDDDEFLAKVNVGLHVLQFLFVISIPAASGIIFNIIIYALFWTKGEVGANEYGADPLEMR